MWSLNKIYTFLEKTNLWFISTIKSYFQKWIYFMKHFPIKYNSKPYIYLLLWQDFLSHTHKWKINFPTFTISDKNSIYDSNLNHKYRLYIEKTNKETNTLNILLRKKPLQSLWGSNSMRVKCTVRGYPTFKTQAVHSNYLYFLSMSERDNSKYFMQIHLTVQHYSIDFHKFIQV